MIIRSFSRKDNASFMQLATYITKETKVGQDAPLYFYNNVEGIEPEEIATEMLENYTKHHSRKRANENSLYHLVLSFHENDSKHLTDNVLADIVYKYIDLHNPEGMTFGAVHKDEDHTHAHLIFGANKYESDELIYLKKKEFEQVKRDIRQYVREQYPQIQHSFQKEHLEKQYHPDHRVHRNIKGYPQQRQRKGTVLDKLRSITIDAFGGAQTFDSFCRTIQKQGYELYFTKRGTINGILFNGKKYRFSTTLLPKQYRESFSLLRKEYEKRTWEAQRMQQDRNRSRDRDRDDSYGWSR